MATRAKAAAIAPSMRVPTAASAPSNDDPAEMQMAMRSSASGSWRSSSSRHSARRASSHACGAASPATAQAAAAAIPWTPPMNGRATRPTAMPADSDATRMAQNDAAGMVTPERESMSRVASATFSLIGT